MAKTSRKPLVVTRTTLAPRRSRRMLVATVIPCTKRETENGATPARPRTALAAPSTPRDCGSVDGTLPECRSDASVHVPPTSTPKKTASSKRPAVLRYGGGPSGSTQVGLLNLRIVKETGSLTFQHYSARLQNIAPVCDLKGNVGILLHKQNGRPLSVNLLNYLKDLLHKHGG